MEGQIDVKCPKCGWEFHAEPGALKAECQNELCREEILIAKRGAPIDATRVEEKSPPKK